VLRQHFVDEGLVADASAARLLAERLERSQSTISLLRALDLDTHDRGGSLAGV
jgi:hypothetical protein